MKKLPRQKSRGKKVVCTVSAAALMLGVSSAATVGLHFQESYCDGSGNPSSGYSGFPVTLTAFGVPPSNWQNLTEMPTGYSGCSGPLGYNFIENITTTGDTNGLNALPNGSLEVMWFGPTANFSGFGGYAGNPPHYNYGGPYPNPNTQPTGEEQVYATFIRDGINFGPGESGGDNNQPGYSVDITGLKSVFTNSPFVVELMASADSMQVLTNAFVVDVTGSVTNSVTYPNTPPVANVGDTPWVRGQGGGLSTGSAPLNTDHIQIMSNHPQHVADPGGFNHAGTISGLIITDKPVITMAPRSVLGGPQDTVALSTYAIGVPPLSYQWRRNGAPIPQATNLSLTITGFALTNGGSYDFVATNLYGSATSPVATVTADVLTQSSIGGVVADTNPNNPPHDGLDNGATWLASSTSGSTTRTGVMQFVAANSNGISVTDTPNFQSPTGTISFWMRSAGNDGNGTGTLGASLFCVPSGSANNDFILLLQDGGNIQFQAPNNGGAANIFASQASVIDNNWHFIALTFDQSISGDASLYIDGVLDTEQGNFNSWTWPAAQNIELGYSTDPTWRYYDGLLDDVRFYTNELSPSQISGIYTSDAIEDAPDLQLRLNFDTPPQTGVLLTWLENSGVLQSSSSVNGPYTDVPAAASPYLYLPQAGQKFFRYRYVPQSVVSNPYLM